jgi:hypothetical protein
LLPFITTTKQKKSKDDTSIIGDGRDIDIHAATWYGCDGTPEYGFSK